MVWGCTWRSTEFGRSPRLPFPLPFTLRSPPAVLVLLVTSRRSVTNTDLKPHEALSHPFDVYDMLHEICRSNQSFLQLRIRGSPL